MEKEAKIHRSLRLKRGESRGDERYASVRTSTPLFRLNGSSCSEVVVGNGSSQQWILRSTIESSVNLPIQTKYEEFSSTFTKPHSPSLNTGAPLQYYPRVMQDADILAFLELPLGQTSPQHQLAMDDDRGMIYPPGFDLPSPSSPLLSQPTPAGGEVMMMSDTCLLDVDNALRLTVKGETLECYTVLDDGHKVITSLFLFTVVINFSFM